MDKSVEDFIVNIHSRPSRSKEYPIFDSLQAWLVNKNGIISHNILQTLKRSYSAENWKQYAERKYNFCSETRKMIATHELGKALLKHRPQKSQSVKLLHGVQFTSEVRKRWGLSEKSQCPICQKSFDSRNHFLFCEHPIMKETHLSKQSTLTNFLNKYDTHPKLCQVLLHLYNHSDTITSQSDFPIDWELPHALHIAIASQQDIGFSLFNLGLVTNEFGKFQESTNTASNLTASRWTQQLITTLLQISREKWALRCKILHAENEETLNKIYRHELWTYAKTLRQDWWRFSPTDRNLINVDESFFLKSPMRRISMWKQQISVAQETGFYQAMSSTKDIRHFFPVENQANERPPKRKTMATLIPTQVMYRQTKLTSSPRTSVPIEPTPRGKVNSTGKKKPTSSRITNWLVRKNEKRKNFTCNIHADPVEPYQLIDNFLVDVSSRPAEATVASRKIKYFN